MSTLGYILVFTFIGSVGSLIGGFILLSREKLAIRFSHFLFSFAAGVLLGTAFFDLLPEAMESNEELIEAGVNGGVDVFLWTVVGILMFFMMVRTIHWFHHHEEHDEKEQKTTIPLVLMGDSVHNFIDGIVIASTFLVSIPLGIITSLAVAAHEIPQEIGDFAIMLKHGIRKPKIVLFNLLSACFSLVAAVITYIVGDTIKQFLPILLSLTAGFFIYIASSDLIPELHKQEKNKMFFLETVVLVFGVGIVWFLVRLLEG